MNATFLVAVITTTTAAANCCRRVIVIRSHICNWESERLSSTSRFEQLSYADNKYLFQQH
jgi:hypothetical protein